QNLLPKIDRQIVDFPSSATPSASYRSREIAPAKSATARSPVSPRAAQHLRLRSENSPRSVSPSRAATALHRPPAETRPAAFAVESASQTDPFGADSIAPPAVAPLHLCPAQRSTPTPARPVPVSLHPPRAKSMPRGSTRPA